VLVPVGKTNSSNARPAKLSGRGQPNAQKQPADPMASAPHGHHYPDRGNARDQQQGRHKHRAAKVAVEEPQHRSHDRKRQRQAIHTPGSAFGGQRPAQDLSTKGLLRIDRPGGDA
jgi:hypothetical protein